MLGPAIRFTSAKGPRAKGGFIQLLCRVKPGVSASREGISAVSDEAIEVCVTAQAKEGEANKAVREVIAQVLKVPKSDVEIAKGMKSREKVVIISNIAVNQSPEDEIERIRIILQESMAP